jgi:hypothetical protein
VELFVTPLPLPDYIGGISTRNTERRKTKREQVAIITGEGVEPIPTTVNKSVVFFTIPFPVQSYSEKDSPILTVHF